MAQKQLGQIKKVKLGLSISIFHIPVYKRGCGNQMRLPVMKFNNQNIIIKAFCGYWRGEKRKRPSIRKSEVAVGINNVKDSCWFDLSNSCCD